VNVSSAKVQNLRDVCSDRVYSRLLELNALDLELVKRARAEVKRRFEMVPNHAAKLAALEAELSSLSPR
jgi:hypothetical protein